MKGKKTAQNTTKGGKSTNERKRAESDDTTKIAKKSKTDVEKALIDDENLTTKEKKMKDREDDKAKNTNVSSSDDSDEDESSDNDDSEENSDDDEGEDESDGDGEVEVEELSLELDKDGRVTGWVGKMNFGFRSFKDAVTFPNAAATATTSASSSTSSAQATKSKMLEDLIHDCRIAFTARSTKSRASYSEGETFWVPATNMASPATALEKLASEIFAFHTKDIKSMDPAKSGAEWWTLVLDDAQNSDVGFHWDKDYTVENDCNLNVFPHVGTVTYLSDVGAPTLVMDKTAPPEYDESIVGAASTVWMSRPSIAKHISFDGRFLHAAPSDLISLWPSPSSTSSTDKKSNGKRSNNKKGKKEASSSGTRVSFLVNIWLNHKPVSGVPFPSELASKMKTSPSAVKMMLNTHTEQTPDTIPVNVANINDVMHGVGDVDVMRWSFRQAKKHTVVVPIPSKALTESGAAGNTSFTLQYKKAKPEVQ